MNGLPEYFKSKEESTITPRITEKPIVPEIPTYFREKRGLEPTKPIPRSPLDIPERIFLGFSDKKGKEMWLKEEFGRENVQEIPIPTEVTKGKKVKTEYKKMGNYVVRKDNKWYSTDPSGKYVADFPGDVSDFLNQIFPIGGAIGGAAMGAATGAILGIPGVTTPLYAGMGAMAGEEIRQRIGMGLGVREKDLEKMKEAVETTGLTTTITYALFHGLNRLVGPTWKFLKEVPHRYLGAKPEAVNHVMKRGMTIVGAKEKSDFLPQVAGRFNKALDFLTKQAGNSFRRVIQKSGKGVKINSGRIMTAFKLKLKKMGYMDSFGNFKPKAEIDPKEAIKLNRFMKFLKSYTTPEPTKGRIAVQRTLLDSKEITAEQAQELAETMWKMGKSFKDGENKMLADMIRRGFKTELKNKVPGYSAVNEKYGVAKTYDDLFRKMVNQYKGIEQKIGIETRPEQQIKNFIVKGDHERTIMKKLDDMLPKEYKFYDDLLDSAYARDLSESMFIGKGFLEAAGKWAMRTFEPEMKAIVKYGPGAEKITEKVMKPILKYGLKPRIATESALGELLTGLER